MPARATGLARPLWHPATLIATWFGVGLLPWAPGTWGSLAALPLGWLVLHYLGRWELLGLAVLLFAAGCWASAASLRPEGEQDPGAIVIDEVAGQLLVLLAAAPTPRHFVAAFVLFRLADIVKPWPASWADRRLEGGLGVMADDALAALYALVILHALGLWWS